jgi:hypothetical protein
MIITKAELAEELGIAGSGVSKLLSRGLPARPDGRIDLLAACRWIVDNNQQGGRTRAHAREWAGLRIRVNAIDVRVLSRGSRGSRWRIFA